MIWLSLTTVRFVHQFKMKSFHSFIKAQPFEILVNIFYLIEHDFLFYYIQRGNFFLVVEQIFVFSFLIISVGFILTWLWLVIICCQLNSILLSKHNTSWFKRTMPKLAPTYGFQSHNIIKVQFRVTFRLKHITTSESAQSVNFTIFYKK